MVFDKQRLKQLRQSIESECGLRWDEAIVNLLKYDDKLSFSEFETYGNLFPKDEKLKLPWREKMLLKVDGRQYTYEELGAAFSARYLSVTLPDYKRLTPR